jgi:dihydrofolate synthase/folylpolyglutamate synthase
LTAPLSALLERLYALEPRGAELGLERMAAACARFDHPERVFPAVHVAGTNGKGSVAAMTAAMGRAAGRKTGLYTSPHLCRFAERIQIDGEPVPDDLLAEALEQVLDRAPELTFFEATTLTAFALFARTGVDIGVVEVGLGGRLDATNVMPKPRVTAITRVAFDHMDRLGSDIPSIAAEKAGIAKGSVPLVLGPLSADARAVVDAKARAVGATIVDAAADASLATLVRAHPPALAGSHQRDNALVAAAIGRAFGLSDRHIGEGLERVRWPGRCELLSLAGGDVLLDAAHNLDGASALSRALAERGVAADQTALVFGAMADKDYGAMLALLAPLASHRYFVTPGGRRAADPRELALRFDGEAIETVGDALGEARAKVGPRGLVLVAGSIFLVGEARAMLLGLPRDRPIAL